MTSRGVNDLNDEGQLRQASGIYSGGGDACRKARVRPSDGVRAVVYLSSLGCKVPGQLQRAQLQLPRPVHLHGVRAAYLPGKPAGHRSLSGRATGQALPLGHPRQDQPQQSGRCQRDTGLAHSLRIRPGTDPDCSALFMPTNPWLSIWTTRCTPWTRRRSTCVCRCFRGRRFAKRRRRSSCIRCSICAVPSRPSSSSRTASCTTSMCWTSCCRNQGPST